MQTYPNCLNITVDGSSELTDNAGGGGAVLRIIYENIVLSLLDDFAATFIGLELFNSIRDRGVRANRTLTIVPYSKADRASDPANAFSGADDFRAAQERGTLVWGQQDDPKTPEDDRFDTFGKGTGGGSSVHVHFSSDVTFQGTAGMAPDEILFHEMCHSLRQMQGEFEARPTGDTDVGYDNVEEFFAVLISNIYISEKNPNAPLRKDHHGFDQLPDEESTSIGFLLNNSENLFWIKWLFPHEKAFFAAVAGNVMATFNPLREYFENQDFYDSFGPDATLTETYIVTADDTLSSIALKLLGDAKKWRIIYALNRGVIGPNPNRIIPGQALTVPMAG